MWVYPGGRELLGDGPGNGDPCFEARHLLAAPNMRFGLYLSFDLPNERPRHAPFTRGSEVGNIGAEQVYLIEPGVLRRCGGEQHRQPLRWRLQKLHAGGFGQHEPLGEPSRLLLFDEFLRGSNALHCFGAGARSGQHGGAKRVKVAPRVRGQLCGESVVDFGDGILQTTFAIEQVDNELHDFSEISTLVTAVCPCHLRFDE